MARTQTIRSETPQRAADAAELLRACAADGRRGADRRRRHEAVGPARAPTCGVQLQHRRRSTRSSSTTPATSRRSLQPGVSLRELDETLAAAGQMLALDPPLGERRRGDRRRRDRRPATPGPLRHRYGAARDLVLGVTVALPDGTLARAGGKVIKNVAGYDLAKLFSGSFGTLGLIAEVAVRLHPRPRAQATATGTTDDPAQLARGRERCSRTARWSCSRSTCAGTRRWARCSRASAASPRPQQAAAAQRAAGARPARRPRSSRTTSRCGRRQRAAQRSAEGGAVVRVSGRPTQLADACVAAQVAGATLVGRAGARRCRGSRCRRPRPASSSRRSRACARCSRRRRASCSTRPRTCARTSTRGITPEDAALVLMRRVKAALRPDRAPATPAIFVGGI